MTAAVTVIGLGPGDPGLVTASVAALINDWRGPIFLRTRRHPAAVLLGACESFDSVYDEADSLDEVYRQIVEQVIAAARDAPVLYAVPGSPSVAEHTVELLRARRDVDVTVHPALSFLELAWTRLGIDPVATGVRIIDAQRFAIEAAGQRGPLLLAQVDQSHVLDDVLAMIDEPPNTAVILSHLGTVDESVVEVPWGELSALTVDHLTTIYLPTLAAPIAGEVQRFADLVADLRAGCPWDAEQTHSSLRRHLLEETYEVLEAIDEVEASDAAPEALAHLEEELGDLLFQVVFHARLGAEVGAFDLATVATGVHDKLRARHPHVFADVAVSSADEVVANWEQIKKAEKGRSSVLDGIPAQLPATQRAGEVHRKSAAAGMDFPSVESAYDKVTEELEEVRADPCEREVGDLLFAAAGVAMVLGIEPEIALRSATARFERRFRHVERAAEAARLSLHEVDQERRDLWWQEAKRATADS